MAETFNKKEREKKKDKRRKDKLLKKEARKENAPGGFESMIAYVDENGILSDTPPDPSNKVNIDASEIGISVAKREKEEIDPVLQGTISYYDATKGYGFIKVGDENFFMHRNNVSGEPAQGKRVLFEKEKGAKGWAAVKVVVQ